MESKGVLVSYRLIAAFFHHLGRERKQLLGLSQPPNSLGNEVRLNLGYIDLTMDQQVSESPNSIAQNHIKGTVSKLTMKII
jgi:hypothetical protein